jgi:hypothetical protein
MDLDTNYSMTSAEEAARSLKNGPRARADLAGQGRG